MSLDFDVVPKTDLPTAESLADGLSARLTRDGFTPPSIVALEADGHRAVTGALEDDAEYGFWVDGDTTTVTVTVDYWLGPPSHSLDSCDEDLALTERQQLEAGLERSNGRVVSVSSVAGRDAYDKALLQALLVELGQSTDGYVLPHDRAFEGVPLEQLVRPDEIENAVWRVLL